MLALLQYPSAFSSTRFVQGATPATPYKQVTWDGAQPSGSCSNPCVAGDPDLYLRWLSTYAGAHVVRELLILRDAVYGRCFTATLAHTRTTHLYQRFLIRQFLQAGCAQEGTNCHAFLHDHVDSKHQGLQNYRTNEPEVVREYGVPNPEEPSLETVVDPTPSAEAEKLSQLLQLPRHRWTNEWLDERLEKPACQLSGYCRYGRCRSREVGLYYDSVMAHSRGTTGAVARSPPL